MLHFIKQFFIYGFASVIGKIAMIFLMPIYTSVLTPEEYGTMALLVSCKGLVDIFSNLNIHSGVARLYYEDNINRLKLVSTGLFSIIACSLFILGLMLLTQSFWVNIVLDIPDFRSAFILVILSIPANSLLSYFSILTRLKGNSIKYSVGVLLQLVVQISTSLYLVVHAQFGIDGIFYGLLAAEFAGIFYLYILNKSEFILSFSKKYLIDVLKYSLPTLIGIAGIWMDSSLGQIIMGKYISLEELGIYSVALQISSVFLLFQVAIRCVWQPFIYENYKDKNFEKTVITIYKVAIWCFVVILVNISILSKEVILLLTTSKYIFAIHYIPLLSTAYGLSILSCIAEVGANISRDTKYISISYIVGGVVNVLLLTILTPVLGVLIVPLSLLIARSINYFLLQKHTQKAISISLPLKNILFFIFSGVICFGISYLDYSLFLKIVILILFNVMIIYMLHIKYSIFTAVKLLFNKKNKE